MASQLLLYPGGMAVYMARNTGQKLINISDPSRQILKDFGIL